jgi:pimeloyl-ACP methyl ester carboxylesterase
VKGKRFLIVSLLLIVAIYFLGPTVSKPLYDNNLPQIPFKLSDVEDYVVANEASFDVREENEAKIVWADDSIRSKTEYVLLYLHGFSASRFEGSPLNIDFPNRYSCNSYHARLAEHGLNTDEPLLNMTPDNLYNSAKEALVIASRLGNKVIIMGTSTGGTLGLMLAADFPDLVHSLILYSPNIAIKQKSASLILNRPWGLQLGRLSVGGKYRVPDDLTESEKKYWYSHYRVEALVCLQQLIDTRMTEDFFQQVTCPVFMGYYYKDKKNQDQVVDVKAMQKMFTHLATPENKKRKRAFPTAGAHVIACELSSNAVEEVKKETFLFAEEILGLVANIR